MFFDVGSVDFFSRVLVAADNDGRLIDIKKENVIGDVFATKKVFFDGEIHLRVIRIIIWYVEHMLSILSDFRT